MLLARARIKAADIIVIALSLLAVAASALFASRGSAGAARLVVDSPEGRFVYPLDEDALIRAKGPLGETLIKVEDGAARILESPCENQLCASMGAVREKGQWASCLPNRVFIKVSGAAGKDDVDALSY